MQLCTRSSQQTLGAARELLEGKLLASPIITGIFFTAEGPSGTQGLIVSLAPL